MVSSAQNTDKRNNHRHSSERSLFDSGPDRKEAAHDLLETTRASLLLRARHAMLTLLLDRGECTADDIRAHVKIPSDINPVALGATPGPLARAGIVRRTGFAASTRPDAHGRPVSVWQIVSSAKAAEWLRENPLPIGDGYR